MFRILFFVAVMCSSAFAKYSYRGEFSQVNAEHADCAKVFAQKLYYTDLFLTGSGGTKAVLHFEDPKLTGFLHMLTLVGLNGGFGDLKVDKKFELDGKKYWIVAEGIFDSDLLYVNVFVKIEKDHAVICTGSGDYTGF